MQASPEQVPVLNRPLRLTADMTTGTETARDSARQFLRRHTVRHHEALHRHRLLADALRERSDRPCYRTLLAAFYGFHDAFEHILRHAVELPSIGALALPPLGRAALLAADLVDLDLDRQALERLPRPSRLPSIDGVAAYLGATYVLDGSTIGGRVVARMQAGHGPARPVRFFAGDPAGDARRWQACTAAIDRELASHALRNRAAEAAAATFEALHSWLDRWDRPAEGQTS
ncbi:biliverdin-producing heme oxygenase [Marinivivus vitaminiproducens]|uniref:biliverdin-producing heme oxygenase n=1 Tax=Marinivivus vitaminiproducens TaxID=3035935 RepID=UPI0027AA904C|nr:biliverdin-producing heme oxygenase [Geminicoccaceae bacterium SCSIO 64248]